MLQLLEQILGLMELVLIQPEKVEIPEMFMAIVNKCLLEHTPGASEISWVGPGRLPEEGWSCNRVYLSEHEENRSSP